jgi:hypothetical protein
MTRASGRIIAASWFDPKSGRGRVARWTGIEPALRNEVYETVPPLGVRIGYRRHV